MAGIVGPIAATAIRRTIDKAGDDGDAGRRKDSCRIGNRGLYSPWQDLPARSYRPPRQDRKMSTVPNPGLGLYGGGLFPPGGSAARPSESILRRPRTGPRRNRAIP